MKARLSASVIGAAFVLASCAPTQPPPPARAVIFIPGFGGSELVAGAAGAANVKLEDGSSRSMSVSAGEQVWPHFHSSWPPDLGTPLFDPDYYRILRIDGSTDNLQIHASGKLYTDMGGYGDIEAFFTSRGYRTGTTLFLFGWDWRRSADEAVPPLADLIKTVPNLDTAGVDIVAHSAGTLVARAYLTSTSQTPDNRGKVRHVALLSGPGLGVPEADDILLVGHCLHYTLGQCIIPPPPQKYAFATSAGAAQNTTGKAYYRWFHEQDPTHPVPYTTASLEVPVPAQQGGPMPAGSTGDPAQIGYDFLKGALTTAMPTLPMGVAETFRASDQSWVASVLTAASMPSLTMSLWGGTGKCAPGQIRSSGIVERVDLDGDTTVPRQSAIFGDGLNADYLSGIPAGRLSIYVRVLEHGDFAANAGLPDVLRWLRDEPNIAQGTIQPTSCPVRT